MVADGRGGVTVGGPTPPDDPVGVTEGFAAFVDDGVAVLPGTGEARIGVKKVAPKGTVHDAGPAVNVIWISISLLSVSGFRAIGKTANPSEEVVAVTLSVLPSGQSTIAVAVAPGTPSGLPFTLCVNLP